MFVFREDEVGERISYLHIMPVRDTVACHHSDQAKLREGGMLQVNACLGAFFSSHVTLPFYAYFPMCSWCRTLCCVGTTTQPWSPSSKTTLRELRSCTEYIYTYIADLERMLRV